MTRPCASLVSVVDTPYYHCIGRCVRRAYLCGDDQLTGRNFDHRKTWILERLRLLSEVFAIDLCAYAVMSNHYHLVVRLDPERTQAWSDREIVERWTQLFSGPDCVPRYLSGAPLSDGEHALITTLLPVWRARLSDLSWFMRCLNEGIARRANQEDWSNMGHPLNRPTSPSSRERVNQTAKPLTELNQRFCITLVFYLLSSWLIHRTQCESSMTVPYSP